MDIQVDRGIRLRSVWLYRFPSRDDRRDYKVLYSRLLISLQPPGKSNSNIWSSGLLILFFGFETVPPTDLPSSLILILFPAWISYPMFGKVWDEIT